MAGQHEYFDAWHWRRRVIATALSVLSLTFVVAALVSAPPDAPPDLSATPGLSSATDDPGTPPVDGDADTVSPSGSATPGGDDTGGPDADSGDGQGNGGDSTGNDDTNGDNDGGGDPGTDSTPTPKITSVSVTGVSYYNCDGRSGCLVRATVSVTTNSTKSFGVDVTISGPKGQRSYDRTVSGSKSYTFTVPGDDPVYLRASLCESDSGTITASASGGSHSDSGGLSCNDS